MAPCDGNAIRAAFAQTITHQGPIYFRAGRGRERTVYDAPPACRIGGSNTLREGRHATVLAIGNLVSASLEAAELLRAEGIDLGVVDMYSIAPIDRDAIRRAARQGVVITAEEHNVSSGFGSAVAEVIAEEGLAARLVRIGVPDEYSLLGPPTHLYRHYGLDAEGVAGASARRCRKGPDRRCCCRTGPRSSPAPPARAGWAWHVPAVRRAWRTGAGSRSRCRPPQRRRLRALPGDGPSRQPLRRDGPERDAKRQWRRRSQRFGRIDMLVNIAGITSPQRLIEVDARRATIE